MCACLAPATDAAAEDLVPVGTIFAPPEASAIDFGDDPPEERRPVAKDMRVVAVVFSVNQAKASRKAFPDVQNVDLMLLGGKPMITYVIDGLKASHYVDRIVVVAERGLDATLGYANDPRVRFIEDRGDAAENVRHGIGEIDRGDLVLLAPSDLPLLTAESINALVEHARRYENYDVFFPLIQRERCRGTVAAGQRFIRFKEGMFTGAHVELVRPALFVDNAADVQGEKDTMYDVYHMRRDTLGIVRFLGLRLVAKFLVRNLSPADVATRLYLKYHVRAQAFVIDDPRLSADVHSRKVIPRIEAVLRESRRSASPLVEASPVARPGQT